jgi:hypothetical protein
MSDIIDRVRSEMEDLDSKILKLQNFLSKGKPDNIENLDWSLLVEQLGYMKLYSATLTKRLFRLTGEKK